MPELAPQISLWHRPYETGLDYFGARYYSGAQGRFTSPDAPFADQHPEDPQSWNLYTYTRNNPLTYVDPTGKAYCSTTNGTTSEDTDEGNCTAQGGTWVNQPFDMNPEWDAERFFFSTTVTESTGELSAAGQEFFQGNAQLWNDTAGAVNTAAVATGIALTLPAVVPTAVNAVGSLGFGTTAVVGGQASTQVSRWGRAGLEAGDWVMKGAASRWNYFWSGKWEPSWLGRTLGYPPNIPASFSSGQTFSVPAKAVRWPSGMGLDGIWKGLAGQRIYRP